MFFEIVFRSLERLYLSSNPLVLHRPLLVLCPPTIPVYLTEESRALCAITIYHKGEFEKDLAPRWTDCLTAVAYLFRNCQYWRLDWIANMPHKLLGEYGFTLEKRDPHNGMIKGDVVFFANAKGITRHIAIAISAFEVFHCSQANNGGKIEPIGDLFAKRYRNLQPMYCEIKHDRALKFPQQIKKRTPTEPENQKDQLPLYSILLDTAFLQPLLLRCTPENNGTDMDCDDFSHKKKKT